MNSSLRKIDRNKVNNLKRFFENLVCSSQGNKLIETDKNNNNSNGSSFFDKSSTCAEKNDRTDIKKEEFSELNFNKSLKFKNKRNEKGSEKTNFNNKENKNSSAFNVTNSNDNDQISIRSLSKCSLMSDILNDQEMEEFKNNQFIYQNDSDIRNQNELNNKNLLSQEPDSFSFNLFKLLKLMLTAKCYCVLLTEKQNPNDLKKLIYILYEMKQTALKKLSNIDSIEIENANLNDFMLSDLFNLICEIHVNNFSQFF